MYHQLFVFLLLLATLRSTLPVVSPDSSVSSWTPPISTENTPRSVNSRDTTTPVYKHQTPAVPSLTVNPLYTPHVSPPLAPPPPLSLSHRH